MIELNKCYKELCRLFNSNFKKGVTIFQICLMVSMLTGWMLNNEKLVYFSMVACLLGYFEPSKERFYLG